MVIQPHAEHYIGAVPVWTNRHGERVFQVYFEYRSSDWVSGMCHQFMTANGSLDVSK